MFWSCYPTCPAHPFQHLLFVPETLYTLLCADFSFLQRASYMLGNISAPPAFASEFPAKYLAAASQASTSVRVTTGMIRITDISFTGSKLDWSLGKNGHLDIVLSFGVKQNDAESGIAHQTAGPRKANSAVPRSWFYCIFLWIMVLSLSFKISSLVCPRSYMSWTVDSQRSTLSITNRNLSMLHGLLSSLASLTNNHYGGTLFLVHDDADISEMFFC